MRLLLGVVLAATGVASGLVWRKPQWAVRDTALFRRINSFAAAPAVDAAVRLLRPLGTTWGLILVAAAIFAWDPPGAILLLAMAVLSSLMERGLKRGIARKRPFEELDAVEVRQNPPPRDPSFPSGDASRVWFLGSALAFGMGWPPAASAAALALAAVVSLGRVRVGVHYPSDVWAGSWLGFGMGLLWGALLPAFRLWWT